MEKCCLFLDPFVCSLSIQLLLLLMFLFILYGYVLFISLPLNSIDFIFKIFLNTFFGDIFQDSFKTIFKLSFFSSKIQTFGFNRQISNFPLFLSIEQISIYRYCYKLFFYKYWNFFLVWNFFFSIFTPKNQNARFSFEKFNFSLNNREKCSKTEENQSQHFHHEFSIYLLIQRLSLGWCSYENGGCFRFQTEQCKYLLWIFTIILSLS